MARRLRFQIQLIKPDMQLSRIKKFAHLFGRGLLQLKTLFRQPQLGLLVDDIIECPKHNGRFDYRTGAAKGAPVCVDLKIYQAKTENGKVFINLA